MSLVNIHGNSGDRTAPGAELKVIESVKPAHALADLLRQQILSRTLEAGSTLPPERVLVERTGLSRGAVRQALRILQGEGLVETRPGRFGGSTVKRPSHDALTYSLSLFVEGHAIPLPSLLEFREAISGAMAALAARNRTDEDIAQLQEIGRRMEVSLNDPPVYFRDNVDWQIAFATATHNELFTAVIRGISELILKASSLEEFAPLDVRKLVIKAHQRILAAVIARDPDEARRRMDKHVATIAADMLAYARQSNASAPPVGRVANPPAGDRARARKPRSV